MLQKKRRTPDNLAAVKSCDTQTHICSSIYMYTCIYIYMCMCMWCAYLGVNIYSLAVCSPKQILLKEKKNKQKKYQLGEIQIVGRSGARELPFLLHFSLFYQNLLFFVRV